MCDFIIIVYDFIYSLKVAIYLSINTIFKNGPAL